MSPRTNEPPPSDRSAVTADRFVRLHKMVRLMSESPRTREALAKQLSLDLRGFYRDLDLLRSSGVAVTLEKGQYGLGTGLDKARAKLPFPDPLLTLGDMRTLSRGKSAAHRKLREHLDKITA